VRKLLLIGVALMAFVSPVNARSLSYVCDGKISVYRLNAYTAIAGKDGKDVCIFVTNSAEGRKILKICPKGSQCSVEAYVDMSSEYEIFEVISVHRTGTPALDARAKKDKEAKEKRRWASILPYQKRTTDCILAHLKDEVSQDAVDDVLENFCARQRDALAAEYNKQFGPGGNYLYLDYYQTYKEGIRDWFDGLCYRARPYLDGPPEKAAAWERGWQDAQRRNPEPVDRSYCFPGRN